MCNQINLFDDGQAIMAAVQDHSELKEMTKNLTIITMLEDRVTEWVKKVMEVITLTYWQFIYTMIRCLKK